MKTTKLRSRLVNLMIFAALVVAAPMPVAAQSRPAAGNKAGSITALLPEAKITRGLGKNKVDVSAKKGDDVVWNDLVRTERGGRARITLTDQSILSLGSQAELRIVKHDARSQQTALQLGYGRVRAEVAAVTRDGGRFELRTPTAVAGVIGTDFGTDASVPGVSAFLCITGVVQVSNVDPKVPGMVPCSAGMTTTVSTGTAPTPPKPATPEQIQQLIQDTEPATISAFSPASALSGTDLQSAASGNKLADVNAVTVSGGGVTVALEGTPTETGAVVKISIAPDATPGPRTILFTKANGQVTAGVFTVLAQPRSGAADDPAALKKTYLDIIEVERQSAFTGINAVGLGVQQSASDTFRAIQDANNRLSPPMDVSQAERDLGTDVAPLLNAMVAAGGRVNDESANTKRDFDTAFDAAVKALIAQTPPPSPDERTKALKDLFDSFNGPLMSKYRDIMSGLGGTALAANGRFPTTLSRWLERIRVESASQRTVPIPKVDADERIYELGAPAAFDAGRSQGGGGSPITGYHWVLCDPGYKPAQTGVVLPATDTSCRPLPGFGSSISEFRFDTCELDAKDHIARVTVTDGNGKSAAMDVRLRLIPPGYDNPAERLRSLANAYSTLQPDLFLSFFDQNFTGLTELQESIRRTFITLASMNINLRVSQSNAGCNETTTRADWDQAYTFKNDQTCANQPVGVLCEKAVFHQTEQLTVRMRRIPGRNWYITELQGDNGSLQGKPPGPVQTDVNLPDFEPTSIVLGSGPGATRDESPTAAMGVAPGLNTFEAHIINQGRASFRGTLNVRFSVRDRSGNELAFAVGTFEGILDPGQTVGVFADLNIPDLGPGIPARVLAEVNPGCRVPEMNCDGSNILGLDVVIGTTDLALSNLQAVGTLTALLPAQFNVSITNLGSRASNASVGNLKVSNGANVLATLNIPSIAPGATIVAPLNVTLPSISGNQAFTVNINPAAVGDINTVNDTITGVFNVGIINLSVTNLVSVGNLISTQPGVINITVSNVGNRPSVASTGNLKLSNGANVLATLNIPSIAGGASIVVPMNFTMPNVSGLQGFTVAINPTSPGDVNTANDTVAGNLNVLPATVDFKLTGLAFNGSAPPYLSGQSVAVIMSVQNAGTVISTAGNTISCRLNGPGVQNFTPIPLAQINAGATLTGVIVNFIVPVNFAGNDTLTCAASQDPLEGAGFITDNAQTIAMLVNSNVDLQLVNLPPATGIEQMSAASSVPFAVKNFGLDTAPAGWDAIVSVNGQTMGTFLSTNPLAAGATTTTIQINYITPQISTAPADVPNVPAFIKVNNNNAIPETNTANNTFNATLRLVDFQLATVVQPAYESVKGRSFTATVLTILPVTYPLPINISYANMPAGITNSGNNLVTVGGTPNGSIGTSTVSASGTVQGVNHPATATFDVDVLSEIIVQPGTPAIAFAAMGGGGISYFHIGIVGGIYPLTLSVTQPTGIVIMGPTSLASPDMAVYSMTADDTAAVGNQTFLFTVTDTGSSPNTPGNVVQVNVPYQVVGVGAQSDLAVDPPVGVNGPNSNFGGRNFTTNPLLAGEGGDFQITVHNVGGAASTPNVPLNLTWTLANGPAETSPVLIPSIPPTGQTTLTVHVRAPDRTGNFTTILFATAGPDPIDDNFANNTGTLNIPFSDWSLALLASGGSTNPLNIVVPSPGIGLSQVTLNILGPGTALTPIQLVPGVVNTFITPTIPPTLTTTQNVNLQAAPAAPPGNYAANVLGKMMDGATVGAIRGATIHINVNGGTPVDFVTLASSRNNAIPLPAAGGCTGGCVPVQLDGFLVESLNLTPTRLGGSSGAVDLLFSDDLPVISRVTAAGSQLPQGILGVPYTTPAPVNFTAADNGFGNVTTGSTNVTVSATAVTLAQRSLPIMETVGSQLTGLFFNVGDIFAQFSGFDCIEVPPGSTTSNVPLVWTAVNGFTRTVNWTWASTGGANFTITPSSGSTPSPYATNLFNFTNNEAGLAPNQYYVFRFDVTISNGNGSATKSFDLNVVTTPGDCSSLFGVAGREAAGHSDGFSSKQGVWRRGPTGGPSSSAGRSMQSLNLGLPDLQIKPVDVTLSPSIPRVGDMLDVRFKVSNTGDADAVNIPIALQIDGNTVASDLFTVKKGGSSLGGLQGVNSEPKDPSAVGSPERLQGRTRGDAPVDVGSDRSRRPSRGTDAQAILVVDPLNSVKQKTNDNKVVALSKVALGVDSTLRARLERAYLEMNTICVGFRLSSGAAGNCEGGGDVDIMIEDIANSRYSISALNGIADLGAVDGASAATDGVQFSSRVALTLGHAYAVQLSGGKVGVLKISNSLTPRQLEAEANRRFSRTGVRIIRNLGFESGISQVGDVSGRVSHDAIMYFDMTFRP